MRIGERIWELAFHGNVCPGKQRNHPNARTGATHGNGEYFCQRLYRISAHDTNKYQIPRSESVHAYVYAVTYPKTHETLQNKVSGTRVDQQFLTKA